MTCERRRTSATVGSTIPDGALPQPKAGLTSGVKEARPPPTVATAPLRTDREGPFSKVTVQSLV